MGTSLDVMLNPRPSGPRKTMEDRYKPLETHCSFLLPVPSSEVSYMTSLVGISASPPGQFIRQIVPARGA